MTLAEDFGLSSMGFKKEDFLRPGYISQIGYPPLRIDILNNIDGVEFEEAAKGMQRLNVEENFTINYIGKDDLLKNKLASGREQDLADVKEIKKIKPVKRIPGKNKGKRL
jgi:hypothetical protein